MVMPASLCTVRGDIPEELEISQLLAIGLFDGIAALRVALDVVKAPVAGYIGVEKNAEARRVVEAHFPDSEHLDDVEQVTEEVVKGWGPKILGGESSIGGVRASLSGRLRIERRPPGSLA